MQKLVLKFQNSVLKEVPVGKEVSIGRSPDNGIVIDNPAVSNRHARVYSEEGRLMLEDFGSLNGTFVNGQRVKMVSLKAGDAVNVGKHTIVVQESGDSSASPYGSSTATAVMDRPAAPRINETVVLDTKERREFLQKVAAAGENSQISPTRLKVPTLVIRKGKTDQQEYLLNDKLTVIGKSAMATVKLRGWFAPKAAAQINRREDNTYFIGAADKTPEVNGKPITHPTKLNPGDYIKVGGVEAEFVIRD
jgi:pSer/pThr/pTyr-binding forkhead associated (FHA) protein